MKRYSLLYYEGRNVFNYTGDINYPFYYGGRPFYFERREQAERIMQDLIISHPAASKQGDFRIVEV